MNYIDMHCDTLTFASDKGLSLRKNNLQLDFERLCAAGCAAQCFAIFMQGGTREKFYEYAAFFRREIYGSSDICAPVLCCADLEAARSAGKLGCILTAENIGFISSSADIAGLYAAGVRMASLVWNDENALAYPNLKFRGGKPDFRSREECGLKPRGRDAAAALDNAGIIIDVSHLSDGGLSDLLRGRKKPLVASHSNAFAMHPVSRNLTDGQIRGIADCGGIAAINFCLDFSGGENAMEGALLHVAHIIDVGGEDCAAIGSDFDGMLPQAGMESCEGMPVLLCRIAEKFGPRIADKVARGNFERVLREVCG